MGRPLSGLTGSVSFRRGLGRPARVVKWVIGLALGERMQLRIFDPLGITNAQFRPITREDLRAILVDLSPEDVDAVHYSWRSRQACP